MTTQHTPGPWIVLNTGRPERGSAWRDVCSMGTEFTPSYVGEALEHDAALISAAPDLLDALQRFVTACDAYLPEPTHQAFCGLFASARAAIAKATGN